MILLQLSWKINVFKRKTKKQQQQQHESWIRRTRSEAAVVFSLMSLYDTDAGMRAICMESV